MQLVLSLMIAILGLLFGSFMAAWMYRQRHGTSVAKGRSACPHCDTLIFWYDNIPVISFALLQGSCRSCGTSISWRYPITEALTGMLFLVVTTLHLQSGYDPLILARDLVIVFFLLYVFLYDLWYMEIWSEQTVYPAIALFFCSMLFGWMSVGSMLLGVCIGAGFFALQFVISRGRWIGGGDIRLGVLMGVVLGWQMTILALMLAYMIGAVVVIPMVLLGKKKMAEETPFGTYLTVSTFLVMLFGGSILTWYIQLIS